MPLPIRLPRWRARFRELLDRLSDQDAYRRYLQRTGQPATSSSWQGFLEERHAPGRGPRRCC